MKQLLSVLALTFTAAISDAQVAVPPFTGGSSEGFESSQPPGFMDCVHPAVFGGAASLCASNPGGTLITTSWTGTCTAVPHGGLKLFGTIDGHAILDFPTPVARFGAYFTTNTGIAGGTAFFYGPSGPLGSAPIELVPTCTWKWSGWEDLSGTGFSSIELYTNFGEGEFLALDDMQADFLGGGTPYCSGDGSSSPCPCLNLGMPDHGCANGAGPAGCALNASGSTNPDTLVLRALGALPGQPGLFFQGEQPVHSGTGTPFGDGLRCAGQNVMRLQVVICDAHGLAATSVSIGARGGVGPGAGPRYYQFWYRDPAAGPCGSGFNLSNGLEVVW